MSGPEKPARPEPESEASKRKKLWQNLFIVNLCLSLLLIALFWLPSKLVDLDKFLDSPSVTEPGKGEGGKAERPAPAAEEPDPPSLAPSRTAVVYALSDKDWVYFNFATGAQIPKADPAALGWDLAFRRGKILSNSGATNKNGNAGLIDLGEAGFHKITEVPASGYVQDTPTRTESENAVLLKWYKYNYFSHKLTAKKNVYAVRTADGKYAKVQFLSFYCTNQEAGCIALRYVYQGNGSNSFLKDNAAAPATAAAVKDSVNPQP